MKNPVPPADSLDSMLDRQIGEHVADLDTMIASTPIMDAMDMTQEQAALLAISQDLISVLRLLEESKERLKLFETFIRSLQSQITAIRGKSC